MSLSRTTLLKVLLSFFIVFQVSAAFILPNPESILYRISAPFIVDYGNLFTFNTTWRFFSPNPMIRLLEYEVFSRDNEGKLTGEFFRYPKSLQSESSRETYNRKMNNGMYMMSKPDLLVEVLGPIMCSWHPKAETITVYARGRVLPNIEKSKTWDTSERQELGEIQRSLITDIDCESFKHVDDEDGEKTSEAAP